MVPRGFILRVGIKPLAVVPFELQCLNFLPAHSFVFFSHFATTNMEDGAENKSVMEENQEALNDSFQLELEFSASPPAGRQP